MLPFLSNAMFNTDYSFIPPAARANFQLCPSSVLRITHNQTEYFPQDRVDITCLQYCDTLPLFCQPSLFYGTSEIMIFPEASETDFLVNNCSYYRYTLFNVDTTELAGHSITCGWRLRSGNYTLSAPPLTISVKPSKLLLHVISQ